MQIIHRKSPVPSLGIAFDIWHKWYGIRVWLGVHYFRLDLFPRAERVTNHAD
jgi:hypothetical protein